MLLCRRFGWSWNRNFAMPKDAGWPTTYDCDSRQVKLATDAVEQDYKALIPSNGEGRVIHLTPEWSAIRNLDNLSSAVDLYRSQG